MAIENLRTFIVVFGWALLIGGSIFVLFKTVRFWIDVNKSIFGKLILVMVTGWLVTMYSLGSIATLYMYDSPASGVANTAPIFLVWFFTMAIIVGIAIRWSKEAVVISAVYRSLESLVVKRTEDLEKAYRRQIAQEQEIRKLRDRFIFIAAHELRHPVTAIKAGLGTLLEDGSFKKSLSEENSKIIDRLKEKNDDLEDLIANLLDTARMETGTFKTTLENIRIEELIESAVSGYRVQAEKSGVTLQDSDFSHGASLVVADKKLVKEVLNNLLSNAIKYNKKGGAVKIETEKLGGYLAVKVRDEGIGMSDEEAAKIFMPFYRIENNLTQDIGGTGLGLFLCKQYVEKMNGTIRAESKVNEGSQFIFTLPLV